MKPTKRRSKSTPSTALAQKTVSELAKDKLEALLPQIQARHEMVERHLAGTLECAQEAGEALLEAKKLTGHGGWLPYLKECGIPARTASDYMRIAKNWTKAKSATLPDLSYRGAVAYIRREEKEEKERLARLGLDIEDQGNDVQQDSDEQKTAAARQAEYAARQAKAQAEWDAEAPARKAEEDAEDEELERRLTMAQDLVTEGYRVLSKKMHPDARGGSKEAQQELNAVRDRLQTLVAQEWDPFGGRVRS